MISMELKGQDEALAKLKAVTSPQTRRAILDDFGSYLVSETQGRFENERAPDGTPWQKSFRAKEQGGVTLTDKGFLKGSITYNHDADTLEVGTNKIYAAIHQFGGEIKSKSGKKLAFRIGGALIMIDKVDIPARPYLGFTAQDKEELAFIVSDHWKGAIQ